MLLLIKQYFFYVILLIIIFIYVYNFKYDYLYELNFGENNILMYFKDENIVECINIMV